MKLNQSQRAGFEAMGRGLGISPDCVAAGIAAMEGRRGTTDSQTPLAVSQAEAGRLLQVSRWSISRLVAAGKLRAVRIGGLVRYSRAQVEALVEQGQS